MADERLFADYLSAFSRANPGSTPPVLTAKGSWVQFGDGGVVSKYRRKKVVEMTNILRERAVHLSHCNIDPYEGSCKYGEDETCPALIRPPSLALHTTLPPDQG